ncbi:hypothetical protein ACFPTY_05685 [Halomonas beimenensis]|uniref:Lipoprotein n=1 Tax=Halomonas beimenensis TaxID=475662 RepID=A0A291P6E7_9GAMM|nr:hypothetical protein [Halomonas beimenensis]ATJ82466.1 hypothetical protein BEI_1479 [Halomonas beimenensis]
MPYRPLLLMILLCAAVVLAGCSYSPARISPEPLIVIDDDYDRGHGHHRHGRGFCPPGQAMKGRC